MFITRPIIQEMLASTFRTAENDSTCFNFYGVGIFPLGTLHFKR